MLENDENEEVLEIPARRFAKFQEYDQADWEAYWKDIRAYEEELAKSSGKKEKEGGAATLAKPPAPQIKSKIGPYKIIMPKEYEQERINALRNEQKYHDDKKAMFSDMLTFLDGPLRSAVMNDQNYQRAKMKDDVKCCWDGDKTHLCSR
eukprot:scaffold4597_cov177-Ochromonas_danica.AAC.4